MSFRDRRLRRHDQGHLRGQRQGARTSTSRSTASTSSKIDAIAANIGFPLDGKLFGTIKLELPEGKASKANGNVALEIRDMNAGNTKELTVKTPMGPFTLPRLKVGTFTVNGDAKDGVLKMTKVARVRRRRRRERRRAAFSSARSRPTRTSR